MEPITLAYLLIALGLALLVAEVFIPSGGILFVLSCAAIIGGVALTFYYGDTATGMRTLIAVFVLAPLLGAAALYYWPRTRMAKRFILADQDTTLANLPEFQEQEKLRGRYGRALSDLRPAGVVDFDGRRVDVLTEGMMVAVGGWVRCIDVKAGKVVVRPVDKPNLDSLESAELP